MPGGGEEVLGSLPSVEDIENYVGGLTMPVENGEGVLGSLPSLENIVDYVEGGDGGGALDGGGTSEPLGTLPTLADIEDYCDDAATE